MLNPKIGTACELMALEGSVVKHSAPGIRRVQRKPFSIHANDEIAVVSTGVKKEFAKSAIERLLETYPSIKDLVHIGFAGSLNASKFPKGAIFLGSSVQEHDSESEDKIELKESMDILSGIRARTANVVSVKQFITGKTDPQKLAELRTLSDTVDMEAFVTAQACMEHNVTPHVLKLISDTIIEGRSGIKQLLGLAGTFFARKNMYPVFENVLQAIREHRGY